MALISAQILTLKSPSTPSLPSHSSLIAPSQSPSFSPPNTPHSPSLFCSPKSTTQYSSRRLVVSRASTNTSALDFSPSIGEVLGDVSIFTAAGDSVQFKDLWDLNEGVAVVALLRHFGCPCCWELASALKESKARFDSAGVKIIAVGVGSPDKARILAERDKSKLYIFLELVTQGSIYKLYSTLNCSEESLSDSAVSKYTRQILQGLKYLHDHNVIHRDIKCANILVDANGSVKLADFGLAKITEGNSNHSSRGSPYWMAPEVVKTTDQGYGIAADIWSLGCTVLEMLTGKFPYDQLERNSALFNIFRGKLPEIPDSLPKLPRDFIQKCLQVNPRDRPTAIELLNHPFVQEASVQQVNDARSRRRQTF